MNQGPTASLLKHAGPVDKKIELVGGFSGRRDHDEALPVGILYAQCILFSPKELMRALSFPSYKASGPRQPEAAAQGSGSLCWTGILRTPERK